jgi:hypothetical protein
MTMNKTRLALLCTLAVLPLAVFAADGSCSASTGAKMPTLVELYTSEGCNSCPPADQWLAKLKGQDDVVALAFHVDYWDRLGWKDRFASPDHTQRQAQQQRSNGARFSYTPQVVVDGRDRPSWGGPVRADARPAALVDVSLQREGAAYIAKVQAASGAPQRLAAYWAVTENGHFTAVKAGENSGVTLKHDFVVREYQPVSAWQAKPDAATTLTFTPSTPPDGAHPRQLNLVLVDADSGRPVQAIKLGC